MKTKILCLTLGLAVSLFTMAPLLAVDNLGLFELDGNAVNNGSAEDWADLYGGGGSAFEFTGVTPDPAPLSIFTGGRKDIQDIDDWGWKDGAVPDKDDITNAYAAAYNDPGTGDLIVYFGLDRWDNNGDAFAAFWFFKEAISTNNAGGFDGLHVLGDVLVLANFPQNVNGVPEIQVAQWNPACAKAAKDPIPTTNGGTVPDSCAAANLEYVYGGTGAAAICDGTGKAACAISNTEGGPNDPTPSPWPYTSKDGDVNSFPYEAFFEGGINLSELFPNSDGCFASFMAETRSSSSFTASLKDFSLDAFPLCSIDVTKDCANPSLNAAETMITYQITGDIINDGSGTIYNVAVTDSPAFDAGSLSYDGSTASLAGGGSLGYSATITVPLAQNGATDTVTATANTLSDGTGTALSDTAMDTCPTLQVNPAATVSKSCDSIVSILGDPATNVIAQVTYQGEVCNTGDSRLDNVTVTETPLGGTPATATHDLGSLAADPDGEGELEGECKSYSGTYTPYAVFQMSGDPPAEYTGDDPTLAWFHDSVEVTATDIFGDPLSPKPTASASCPLCDCPDPGC